MVQKRLKLFLHTHTSRSSLIYMKATAQTILEKGTSVRVGNRRGVVTYSEFVIAHNGGKVALNTILFTEIYIFKRGFGQNGVWEKIKKPFNQAVNYSFIEIL